MVWAELADAVAAGRPVALITVVDGPGAGRHFLLDEAGEPPPEPMVSAGRQAMAAGRPRTVQVGAERVYIEPYLPAPQLVVVGAGHVAQPVAQLGKLMGFAVTVLDDRPEYAAPDRFPGADRVICDSFIPALRALAPGPGTYLVLVTRGHRHDMDCLRELIERPVAYIGMIGSRIRVETVFRLLEEEHGIDRAHFDKVYAPVGLDLGARTPAEIAVAVAAELLKVRRGGTGESLSRLGRDRIHGR